MNRLPLALVMMIGSCAGQLHAAQTVMRSTEFANDGPQASRVVAIAYPAVPGPIPGVTAPKPATTPSPAPAPAPASSSASDPDECGPDEECYEPSDFYNEDEPGCVEEPEDLVDHSCG